MRRGCGLLVAGAATLLGLGVAVLWMGSRLAQEPEVAAAQGSAEDGARAQQKIFGLIHGDGLRSRGHGHETVVTEAELNRFLSRNLGETARMPVSVRALRLVGDGVVEFKGRLPLRDFLSASPATPLASLVPARWLERPVWLHLLARASLEIGTTRRQHRFLRLDVQRFAIGRQPLPASLLKLLAGPAVQGLLRWRIPDSVEGVTIEPGVVVLKISS